MRIISTNGINYVIFESREEIKILAVFIYNNDFFIRRYYKTVFNYINYISNIKGDLWIDCEYHNRLIIEELIPNIEKYKRKNKLKILDNGA